MFRKLHAFFRLYRADVFLLSFLAFFAGRLLGKDDFSWLFLVQALFVALFPYNFVYTLNSITDVVEDSANKPWRPIPSGAISRHDAVKWLIFLGLSSITGSVVLFQDWEKLLVFCILIFGVFYSLPPFVLKKRGILACFVTGLGIAYPMIIAGGKSFLPCSLSLLLHVLGVTALKDLSDTEGDILAGRKNRLSLEKTCALSAFFMLLSAAGFLLSPQKIAVILPVSSLILLSVNFFFAKKNFKEKIYRKIIFITGITAVAAVVVLKIAV
ncbi:UbiA family prenyltransferase [bacterium]|nr:UbiA family prenyltransferase [bacterium]